jgi:hypothetical protein
VRRLAWLHSQLTVKFNSDRFPQDLSNVRSKAQILWAIYNFTSRKFKAGISSFNFSPTAAQILKQIFSFQNFNFAGKLCDDESAAALSTGKPVPAVLHSVLVKDGELTEV